MSCCPLLTWPWVDPSHLTRPSLYVKKWWWGKKKSQIVFNMYNLKQCNEGQLQRENSASKSPNLIYYLTCHGMSYFYSMLIDIKIDQFWKCLRHFTHVNDTYGCRWSPVHPVCIIPQLKMVTFAKKKKKPTVTVWMALGQHDSCCAFAYQRCWILPH